MWKLIFCRSGRSTHATLLIESTTTTAAAARGRERGETGGGRGDDHRRDAPGGNGQEEQTTIVKTRPPSSPLLPPRSSRTSAPTEIRAAIDRYDEREEGARGRVGGDGGCFFFFLARGAVWLLKFGESPRSQSTESSRAIELWVASFVALTKARKTQDGI